MSDVRKQQSDHKALWESEPDSEQFWSNGSWCVLLRNNGCWYGYVGVEKEHPLFGISRSMGPGSKNPCWGSPQDLLRVHGGLTYSGMGVPVKGSRDKTCDEFWFFGFHCGHWGDFVSGGVRDWPKMSEIYRTIEYVRVETYSLSFQLALVDRWYDSFRKTRNLEEFNMSFCQHCGSEDFHSTRPRCEEIEEMIQVLKVSELVCRGMATSKSPDPYDWLELAEAASDAVSAYMELTKDRPLSGLYCIKCGVDRSQRYNEDCSVCRAWAAEQKGLEKL